MRISRCDLCKRNIKGQPVLASFGLFGSRAELCCKCGAPVLRFLKKHKFVEKETVDKPKRRHGSINARVAN